MSIPLSEFVKFFPLRATGLSWLFGAGSSVSAGVPSAYDLTWDFKRRIYCADQSYPLNLFNNLTDPGIKEQIQAYFDMQEGCPEKDSPEEYSFYFERAFKSARDRSDYIVNQTSGMQLTYGHKAMGILMKNKLLNLIFTTNFDKAFENMANLQFQKVEDWLATDLDNKDNGIKFFQAGKRPLIVKLHGDYFSDKIKNTAIELQAQDDLLKQILSISLDTNGLCIMGYSGRDSSIMEILFESLEKSSSFPNGLYWFIRSGTTPMPEVSRIIETAKSKGKLAELVEIETFDTAWADIIKGFDSLPREDTEVLNRSYTRSTNQPLPDKGTRYPLLRLNALPILDYPATARLYICNAGNTKEVKQKVSENGDNIIAIRKQTGIVGFGPDDEFAKAFSEYGNYDTKIFNLTEKDLIHDDSSTKGLLTMALLLALVEGKPFRSTKRRQRHIIFPNPKLLQDPILLPLRKAFTLLCGKIPNTNITWIVGLEINIQHMLGTPLMLLSPTVITTKTEDDLEGKQIAPFVKEMMANWYNKTFDNILNAWIEALFGNEKQITVTAYKRPITGFNASFTLSRTTAFTKTN